jgi:hypothetical protein
LVTVPYDLSTGNGGITWDEAKAAAESSSYNGWKGHLVTITSTEENQFVDTNFPVDCYWLGGYQPEGSSEPSGNWQWVTGEKWNFVYWNPGFEPNNQYGGERVYIQLFGQRMQCILGMAMCGMIILVMFLMMAIL